MSRSHARRNLDRHKDRLVAWVMVLVGLWMAPSALAVDAPAAPKPATASGKKPMGAVVMKPVTLTDPGMSGMESHTVLVPAGWKAEGGGWWPGANFFRVLPSQDIKVVAPDGCIVRVGPGIAAVDFYPNPQLGVARPAEGGVDNGYPVLYMPHDIDQWKTWLLEKGIAKSYPDAKNIRLKQLLVIPELTQLMQKQLEPIKQLQEQQNQQSAGLSRSFLDGSVYGATVTYEQEGKKWEHLFVYGASYLGMDSQLGRQLWWSIEPNVSYRAPAGELDAKLPLMMTIANSVRMTPQWQKMKADHMAKMNQIDRKGAADRSRIIAQSNREISKIITDGYKERQAIQDETHRQVINSIRGVEDYAVPGGSTTVQLPNTYDHVYGNSNGEYILTNDANYNPNTDPNLNNQTWNTLEVAK